MYLGGFILRAMRARGWLVCLVALGLLAGCVSTKIGREFPSPDPHWIVAGKSDRWGLQRMLGEPFQVGFENGDPTWRWLYVQRDPAGAASKDLIVRFNADGLVKSYSFTSNFPDDLRRLK
jgi:hypothetical protein